MVRIHSTCSWAFPVSALLLGAGAPAFAEVGTTTAAAAQQGHAGQGLDEDALSRLREEIKAELREELKAEIAAELSGRPAPAPEGDWATEEWKWEEPARPELNFFELDGYFRFRYDLFVNLDLDTYFKNPVSGQEFGPFSTVPPVPICNTDVDCVNERSPGESMGSANMRLRLDPTLNVYEDIQIKAQIDLLDNLVLGSTPDSFPGNGEVPLAAFSQNQLPPSDAVNALMDSIRVKRVWAEVMTPLGQLRVGRMASQFGMGLLANAGNGLDDDYGDTVDRILFATQIAGHYIVPAFDWTASGPTSASRERSLGQPFDRDQRDDVDQYVLAILKKDKDEEIKDKLDNDELVANYGVYGVYREQALDAVDYYTKGDPNVGPAVNDLAARGMSIWAYSVWFKLMWRKLLVEVEHVGIIGDVANPTLDPKSAAAATSIRQFGGALRGEYKLLHDALTLHLLVAGASGDDAPGWGLRPLVTSPGRGSWDGGQQEDGKITNFRFDPDFKVDLIFWRQLVGTVTDAIVVRPGVQYNLTEGFGGRLDLVYSRAWYFESTPSFGIDVDNDGTADRPSQNLGVEADATIFYQSEEGLASWLQYGLFVPMAGLDRQIVGADNKAAVLEAKLAHTLQLLFAVSF